MQVGKFPTQRYCNVYCACSDASLPLTETFECVDSFLIVVKFYVYQQIKDHV